MHDMNKLNNKEGENIQLYEVIRVIHDIPIFLEDHLDRLYHSAQLMNIETMPKYAELSKTIYTFLDSEKRGIGNIKLNFTFQTPQDNPYLQLEFIPHHYPEAEEYRKGVNVGLIYADRPVPHAKVHHAEIRDRANQQIAEHQLFETLMIDSAGNITEGSRSNVFFIKNEVLYSAPEETILLGITWIKVLQICKSSGITVIQSPIPKETLSQYDGAFLTGTSPKILPIHAIEQLRYQTALPILKKLQKSYQLLIDQYIEKGKDKRAKTKV